MKKKIAPARLAAFAVLEQVSAGGYASDLLREATANLSPRDAGLAGQIVLGSLRVENQLDHLIQHYSGRAAAALHLPVRIALRTAIYQLRYLERIPAHAAVDDTVELVKLHKRAASGLANAVLRKINRDPRRLADRIPRASLSGMAAGALENSFWARSGCGHCRRRAQRTGALRANSSW